MAEVTHREISIISTIGDLHNQTTVKPKETDEQKLQKIYLGHVNDQHYYSLRPKGWQNKWYKGKHTIVMDPFRNSSSILVKWIEQSQLPRK